jgi:hypothetical protein
LLFIATPALQCFWTWNDDAVRHQRRYSKATLSRLAGECGLEVLSLRYFMFFLSPLLLAVRLYRRPNLSKMTERQIHDRLQRTHRVPPSLANRLLYTISALETPIGHILSFPWGTSILAVLRKGP